jgi:hypothetical protein
MNFARVAVPRHKTTATFMRQVQYTPKSRRDQVLCKWGK